MKILLAFDKFKGTMTAQEACLAAETALHENFEVESCPLSDGGDGFVECIAFSSGLPMIRSTAPNALGQRVIVKRAFDEYNDTHLIESAQVCGLTSVPTEQRNPALLSTRGLGVWLKQIADQNSRVVIGLGGTATHDCGIGVLREFGWKFLNSSGIEVDPVGENLDKIRDVEIGHRIPGWITLAIDVRNPLTGPTGAAKTYASQKGASPEQIEQLESASLSFAELMSSKLGKDMSVLPGSGAAGGLGFGLMLCSEFECISGAEIMAGYADLEERIQEADLILTGEGKLDSQSLFGKLPSLVLEMSHKYHKPCIAVVGENELGEDTGFDQIIETSGFPKNVPHEGNFKPTMIQLYLACQALGRTLSNGI